MKLFILIRAEYRFFEESLVIQDVFATRADAEAAKKLSEEDAPKSDSVWYIITKELK